MSRKKIVEEPVINLWDDQTFRNIIEKIIKDMWRDDGNGSTLGSNWTKNKYMRDGTYIQVKSNGIFEVSNGKWSKKATVQSLGLQVQIIEPNWGNIPSSLVSFPPISDAVKKDLNVTDGKREALKIKTSENLQYPNKINNQIIDENISGMSDNEIINLIDNLRNINPSEENTEELY